MNDIGKKPGPKPKGDKAMTSTERSRLYRERMKLSKQQEATFKLQQGDLDNLRHLAKLHGKTNSELLGGIIGGQLEMLMKLETVLEPIGSSERAKLYRHQAWMLICHGHSVIEVLEQIAGQAQTEIEGESK